MSKPTISIPNRTGSVSVRPRAPQPAPISAAVVEETTPQGADGASLSNAYERIDLASNYMPYDFDSISLRRIVALDHAKIYRAVRNRNMSVLLDALSATCTVDVRKLTTEDFKSVCYWHRANSYLSAPLNVSWRSIYGNDASVSISGSKIQYEVISPTKTRDEYRAARENSGFVLPTCADLEVLLQIDDEEKKFLFTNAEFIDPAPLTDRIEALRGSSRSPSVDARIERLNERTAKEGMGVISAIEEYKRDFTFGIVEKVFVSDPDFDPNAAVKYLADVLKDEELVGEDRVELQAEHDRIADALKTGRHVEAKEEVHALPFNVWTFFPFT